MQLSAVHIAHLDVFGSVDNFPTCVCVGDIVQLGSTTVFRFNHPQEAAEMKDCPDEASPLRYKHVVNALFIWPVVHLVRHQKW